MPGIKSKRIAIFGGSFNPPCKHHRKIAEEMTKRFSLVMVVPCGIRPDKQSVRAVTLEHRMEMVKMAFAGLERVEIDLSDLENEVYTPSYLLQKRYEERFEGAEIRHVLGGDIITGGHNKQSEIHRVWKESDHVWNDFNFTILVRPGYLVEEKDLPPHAELLEVDLHGSGTMARERIAGGKSVGSLVDSKVEDYIKQHGIYR